MYPSFPLSLFPCNSLLFPPLFLSYLISAGWRKKLTTCCYPVNQEERERKKMLIISSKHEEKLFLLISDFDMKMLPSLSLSLLFHDRISHLILSSCSSLSISCPETNSLHLNFVRPTKQVISYNDETCSAQKSFFPLSYSNLVGERMKEGRKMLSVISFLYSSLSVDEEVHH